MATVLFWEKSGCVNNTRQKQMLRAAGHIIEPRDLLTETWSAEALRAFFGKLPVTDWFNRSAPAVKQGRVMPEAVSEAEALAMMLAEPLLIRRPLMQVGSRRMAGFNPIEVDAWIGLQESVLDDLERCPREHSTLQNACGAHG